MSTPMSPEFLTELKTLLLDAADKDEPADGLRNDEVLFGPDSRLGLDSLDALQISMAIQKRYGVRMPDSKDTRRALVSLNNLAEYLNQRRAENQK
ncbi:MAG TPA: phosphopantetheine-binding protein [Rhodocyclaceae bacterium]|nr:phosphopantetheine-binding protein [Rhodocyclaceae bacterium]